MEATHNLIGGLTGLASVLVVDFQPLTIVLVDVLSTNLKGNPLGDDMSDGIVPVGPVLGHLAALRTVRIALRIVPISASARTENRIPLVTDSRNSVLKVHLAHKITLLVSAEWSWSGRTQSGH